MSGFSNKNVRPFALFVPIITPKSKFDFRQPFQDIWQIEVYPANSQQSREISTDF